MQLYSFEKWKAFSLLNLKPSNLEKYSKLLSNYLSPVCDASPRVKVRCRHNALQDILYRKTSSSYICPLQLESNSDAFPPSSSSWICLQKLKVNCYLNLDYGQKVLNLGLFSTFVDQLIHIWEMVPIFILLPLPKQKRHSKHYKYSLLYIKYTFTPSSGIMEILKADWSSLYLAKCYHH